MRRSGLCHSTDTEASTLPRDSLSDTYAHRRNQKRRELLAANLRDFFRIEGDPFRLTDDGKGWQALFLSAPDE